MSGIVAIFDHRPLRVVLFLLLFFQLVSHAWTSSHTYDEIIYPAAGYSYWKTGNIKMNILHHPPLAQYLSGAALLFLQPSLPLDHPSWKQEDNYEFGHQFIYHNAKISNPRLLVFLPRLPVILLTLLLAATSSRWLDHLYGKCAGTSVLILFNLTPEVLAHGSLATTDFPVTFFWILTLLSLSWCREKPGILRSLVVSLFLAGALLSKITSLVLLPIVPLLLILFTRKEPVSKRLLLALVTIAVPFLVICLVYWRIGPAVYSYAILARKSEMSHFSGPFYFLGKLQDGPSIWYFPVALLVKEPVFLLLFGILGGIILFRYNRQDFLSLFVPAFLLFIAACLSRKQIGVRYLLPLTTTLILFASIGIGRFLRSPNRKLKLVAVGGILFSAIEILPAVPNYLSFFNIPAGGPRNGLSWLDDSNLDWGQDLYRLVNYWKSHDNPNLFLDYFGTAEPEAYGLKYIPVRMNVYHEQKTVFDTSRTSLLAVSATSLSHLRREFPWIRPILQSPSTSIVGNTIYLYPLNGENLEVVKRHVSPIP